MKEFYQECELECLDQYKIIAILHANENTGKIPQLKLCARVIMKSIALKFKP